jgi:zinc protease
MWLRWSRALCFVGLVVLPGTWAQAAVSEFQLDNGMKVLVKPDHRAPVVISQVWYRVGSSYEYGGITGISHVLEHMMFKGTDKYAPGEFSRIVAANGGEENAFTGRDYTAYYQELERSRLEVSFELEADRMRNLHLLPEEFAKEVEVVMEERRLRTEDKPRSLTYEQFNAAAFVSSPYQHPVIGWMNDLKNLSVDDLQHWYARWYAPNNAILVVVGDVEPQAVFDLARKHFGPLEPSDVNGPKPRREPEQSGLRRVTVKAPAELPYLLMGYKTPVLNTAAQDWEPYALEVLAGVLDGGDSARFTKHLVREQQMAATAGADYGLYSRLDGLFMLDATPAPGYSVADVEAAIRAEIERLKTELVSADELDRIKAQVVAGKVYEQDSVSYQATLIGVLETVGLGWQRMDEYVERIRAVTAEQVREVAQKYFVDDALTIAELQPLPINGEGGAQTAGLEPGPGNGENQ